MLQSFAGEGLGELRPDAAGASLMIADGAMALRNGGKEGAAGSGRLDHIAESVSLTCGGLQPLARV